MDQCFTLDKQSKNYKRKQVKQIDCGIFVKK